jgi:chromosome segregation ATPase
MKVNYSTGATTANLENRPSITAADKLANDQYAKGLTLEARARAAQQHGKTRREIEELRRLRTKQANSYRENKSVNSFKESIYSKASNPQSSTAAEHARNARTEAANMDPLKAQHGQAQAAIESKQSEITKLKDTIKKQTKEAKSLTGDALTKKTAQIDRNKKALNKKKAELTILKKDQKAIGYDEKAHENLIRGTKDYDKIEETIKNSDKFKGEIKQQAAEIKEYYKNVLGKKPNELKNIDFEQLAVERIADQMVRNGVITDFTELDANRLAALQDLYGKSTA